MSLVNREDIGFVRICDYCGESLHIHDVEFEECHVDLCTHCATEIQDNQPIIDKLKKELCKAKQSRSRS